MHLYREKLSVNNSVIGFLAPMSSSWIDVLFIALTGQAESTQDVISFRYRSPPDLPLPTKKDVAKRNTSTAAVSAKLNTGQHTRLTTVSN